MTLALRRMLTADSGVPTLLTEAEKGSLVASGSQPIHSGAEIAIFDLIEGVQTNTWVSHGTSRKRDSRRGRIYRERRGRGIAADDPELRHQESVTLHLDQLFIHHSPLRAVSSRVSTRHRVTSGDTREDAVIDY